MMGSTGSSISRNSPAFWGPFSEKISHQTLDFVETFHRISPPETYSALIDARLLFMDIDWGLYGFWDYGENVGGCSLAGLKGSPEFLVGSKLISWT